MEDYAAEKSAAAVKATQMEIFAMELARKDCELIEVIDRVEVLLEKLRGATQEKLKSIELQKKPECILEGLKHDITSISGRLQMLNDQLSELEGII
jgi:hypothetical protein